MKLKKLLAVLAAACALTATATAQTLVGWNNLGMHCMDDDYSVFSILPPYNVIDCQLIDASGHLVTDSTGIVVTYEAFADPDGSINSTSIGKTNFWDYDVPLFGADLPADKGLPFPAGNPGVSMPGAGNDPQSMSYNDVMHWFEAAGVPLAPIDDAGRKNTYPLMRLTAKTAGGTLLATTDVVLPVSGEMDCRKCHGSGSGPAARPAGGWVDEPDVSRDYRLNILRLHDENHLGTEPYTGALSDLGYPAEGLEAGVRDHAKPVLCATCHASEALGSPSYPGVKPLTASMHAFHANVVSPDNGMILDNIANRSSCYQCHPGSDTRCLRGAMGSAVAPDGSAAMQCQSCHGNMSQVGAHDREGWLDEPTCQQCHTGSATDNNGQIRYTSVFESDGVTPRVAVNDLFATNPDTPLPDKSLYRFSKGHGGLQCSACHGSTHAIYPAHHRNDNLQNIALQGHAGTLSNCTSCHSSMPNTVSGGPHGMHPIGNTWINRHEEYGKRSDCLSCHGSNRRSTVLSRTFEARTLTVSDDGQHRSFQLFRGANVSCFLCHKREDDGRIGGLFTNNAHPVVTDATLSTAVDTPAGVTLSASDSNSGPLSLELRVVSQPQHGTVALAGTLATYYPDSGFSGPDSFTFAAFDGAADSDLGTVSVSVGDPAEIDSLDNDGDGLPDVVEYALGLSPGFPTTPLAQNASFRNIGGTDYWTLSIPRGPTPPDASVVVEFSSDAVTWTPGVTFAESPFLLEVRDPDPASSHATRLVRIRAVR